MARVLTPSRAYHPTALWSLLPVLFGVAAVLATTDWSFMKAHSGGSLREPVVLVGSGVMTLALLYPRRKVAIVCAALVVLVSALGVLVSLYHSPAAYVLGHASGNRGDFEINYSGAVELYKYGRSPYGIKEKYRLPDPSVSFPFPTYLLFWLSSGLGRWGEAASGLALTCLNAAAALALVGASLKLSGVSWARLPQYRRTWLSLTLLFLAANSHAWTVVQLGQTSVIAVCLLLFGLLFAGRLSVPHGMVSGAMLALGVLIKPNFAPLLLYFPIGSIRGLRGLRVHHLRIFLFAGAFAALFVLASVVAPHGPRVSTYLEFVHKVVPVLSAEAAQGKNVSLLGLFDAALARPLPPQPVSAALVALSIAFGLRYAPASPLVWLVVPLLVSPLTWAVYTCALLPVEFRIAAKCVEEERTLELGLLLTAVGLLYQLRGFLAAVAIIMIFCLALRTVENGGSEVV